MLLATRAGVLLLLSMFGCGCAGKGRSPKGVYGCLHSLSPHCILDSGRVDVRVSVWLRACCRIGQAENVVCSRI